MNPTSSGLPAVDSFLKERVKRDKKENWRANKLNCVSTQSSKLADSGPWVAGMSKSATLETIFHPYPTLAGIHRGTLLPYRTLGISGYQTGRGDGDFKWDGPTPTCSS